MRSTYPSCPVPRALRPVALAASLATLAACTPAPTSGPAAAPAAGQATPAGGAAPARKGPPPEMLQVPADVRAAYRYLVGEGETAAEGGRILRHFESDLNSLNPVLQTIAYELYAMLYLFDPLVAYDDQLRIVGVLAERWEDSPDHLATTMWLRKGVHWHDGTELVARDVCYTTRMILDEKVPAINVRAGLTELAGCDVVDDHTVRFRWKHPFSAGLAMLTQILPLPEHVYHVDDPLQFAKLPANRQPVGSGAWKFVSWESQSRIVLRRNDDYWGPKPHPAETILKIIDSRETALKAAQAGELDEQYVPHEKWVTDVAGPGFADFNKTVNYNYRFNLVALNNKDPLFSDRKVRQAMDLAHDAAKIVRDLYGGLAREISGPFHPETEWYDPSVKPLGFDLARSARMLEEAGWKDTNGDGTLDKGGKEFAFELLYPSGNTISEQMGAVYQQDLARLGITMTLRGLEGATFFDRVNKGEFTAATLAWLGDPDPESQLVLVDSRNAPPVGVNHDFYSNPEVDRLIDAQRAEFDHDKRVAIVRQIQRILAEDVPMIFALTTPERRIWRKSIRGIQINPYGPFQVRPGPQQWWLVAGKGSAAPG